VVKRRYLATSSHLGLRQRRSQWKMYKKWIYRIPSPPSLLCRTAKYYKRVKINQQTKIKKSVPKIRGVHTYITVPIDEREKTVITHFQGKCGGNLPHSGRWPGRTYYNIMRSPAAANFSNL